LQQAPLLHLPGKNDIGGRLLVHFYAFLFFEDWKQDLWTKRFVRDHLRYVDEIQCAAARIVHAIRKRAMERSSQNKYGIFDAFHVRRGDFQYKKTRVSAQDMYDISKDEIPDGMTVYIATDEKDKDFFNNMATHFDLVFLDDFKDLLENVNPNLFGMVRVYTTFIAKQKGETSCLTHVIVHVIRLISLLPVVLESFLVVGFLHLLGTSTGYEDTTQIDTNFRDSKMVLLRATTMLQVSSRTE
jgi:hypothetical protein